jgi:hypothetical protein
MLALDYVNELWPSPQRFCVAVSLEVDVDVEEKSASFCVFDLC